MRTLARLVVRLCLLLPLLMLTSCGFAQHGFLAAAGPVAETARGHFFSIVGWTMIVIVPLFVATPFILWKYRLSRKDTYRPNWTFSWILEGLIWGLPLLIVAILGWNLSRLSYRLDPYKPIASGQPPLNVEVVGLNWKWLFIYPEQGVATANKLVVPADRPISFRLTSATVMQSFLIPRLGSQIYAMPGMVTQLHLLAAKPGQYRGMNTQYNGKGFAAEKFKVHAVSEADFKRWVDNVHSQPALNTNAYQQLAERSILAQPKSYGGVSSRLFKQIVATTKSKPAAGTPGAKPKSEHTQEQEKKRLKRQLRQYEDQHQHGA